MLVFMQAEQESIIKKTSEDNHFYLKVSSGNLLFRYVITARSVIRN